MSRVSDPIPATYGESCRLGDMNRAIQSAASFLAAASVFACARRAGAAETRSDVDTDHLDAADDGGPRHAGFFLRPFGFALGCLGAQMAVAVAEKVAVSVEGALLLGDAPGLTRAYSASVGFPLFPQLFAFHGIYIDPRVEWVWASAGSGRWVGAAALVGYEWTWPMGATVRLGGGAAFSKATDGETSQLRTMTGLRPEADGALGLVF
jgi:hypothetical protein